MMSIHHWVLEVEEGHFVIAGKAELGFEYCHSPDESDAIVEF
jgi:hypothetical protein